MARVGKTRRSHRAQMKDFVRDAAFPRWITVPFFLIICLILWLAVFTDPSGHLATPGMGSLLYVGGVLGTAGYLAGADRIGRAGGKDRDPGQEYKRRRGRYL